MKNKVLLAVFIYMGFTLNMNAQNKVLLEEKTVIMPTYSVAPAEKNPIFFKNEAFQGASRHYYPLKLNDQFNSERTEQPWNFVLLSNDYIEIGILPEIGGKLYYATDKTNNYNFIYKNNVIKPSNIGMTGAWVSGGIEWCVVHHHRASTFLPMNYTTVENEDGSKTVWVGEHEPRHGMRWTIGITVFPDKAYFKVQGRLFNSTPFTHSFLYWANVAAHTNENYQAIFPPSAQLVTYHSKTDFARWPVSNEKYTNKQFNNTDISWWKNVKESESFFVYDLQEDFMGGYDHGKDAGTVHIGDHNIVKGAKLWEWGSGTKGQATEAILTETDGSYVEIMVGAYSDNQPDYSWIRPYEVKEWEQYWYPIKGMKGFKNANLEGAVNLEKGKKNDLFLAYCPSRKINNAKIILKHKDHIVYENETPISPDKPFSKNISLEIPFEMEDIYTELRDMENDKLLISYQPVKLKEIKDLPTPWKGYTSPKDTETVEELFLTGQRVEQFYVPNENPVNWYTEALKRDPGNIRVNTAMGNICLKNGDYNSARKYLSKAIDRLTKDYTRPVTCEALYLQGITLRALGLYEEAIDTLYRATWDYAFHAPAYFQLAQLSSNKGDYNKALEEVNKSLRTNNIDNRAIALKVALLRQLGKNDEALLILQAILKDDPLDFRIRNEYYLILQKQNELSKAQEVLSSIEKDMREFDDNYLELAVSYINDGLFKEAEEVLLRYNGNNPFFDYYLGYIEDKRDNREKATGYFKKAAGHTVDYIFPYRLESVNILKKAMEYNPSDGKAYYYLGNILYEKQPEVAIKYWEKATEVTPALPIVYRNLGWGYSHFYNDIDQAISYYEKAVQLNKNEAIYYSELDALYTQANKPVKTRLKLFEGSENVIKNRDDAFIRLIDVLTLAGESEKAILLLNDAHFSYREGSSNVRDLIINAQIVSGIKYYNNKDYQKALEYFLKSQIQEEEAGSAIFGNRDMQVNFYIAEAYKALGKKALAKQFYKKATALPSGRINIMDYYKGLSYIELGDQTNAKKIFETMISDADKKIQGSGSSSIGIKFGKSEAENIRHSNTLTIRGLGYKGLQQIQNAKNDLKQAIEYSNSNLWAKIELKNL